MSSTWSAFIVLHTPLKGLQFMNKLIDPTEYISNLTEFVEHTSEAQSPSTTADIWLKFLFLALHQSSLWYQFSSESKVEIYLHTITLILLRSPSLFVLPYPSTNLHVIEHLWLHCENSTRVSPAQCPKNSKIRTTTGSNSLLSHEDLTSLDTDSVTSPSFKRHCQEENQKLNSSKLPREGEKNPEVNDRSACVSSLFAECSDPFIQRVKDHLNEVYSIILTKYRMGKAKGTHKDAFNKFAMAYTMHSSPGFILSSLSSPNELNQPYLFSVPILSFLPHYIIGNVLTNNASDARKFLQSLSATKVAVLTQLATDESTISLDYKEDPIITHRFFISQLQRHSTSSTASDWCGSSSLKFLPPYNIAADTNLWSIAHYGGRVEAIVSKKRNMLHASYENDAHVLIENVKNIGKWSMDKTLSRCLVDWCKVILQHYFNEFSEGGRSEGVFWFLEFLLTNNSIFTSLAKVIIAFCLLFDEGTYINKCIEALNNSNATRKLNRILKATKFFSDGLFLFALNTYASYPIQKDIINWFITDCSCLLNIQKKELNGRCPLHLAVMHGNIHFAKAYYALGGNMSVCDHFGLPPIAYIQKVHSQQFSCMFQQSLARDWGHIELSYRAALGRSGKGSLEDTIKLFRSLGVELEGSEELNMEDWSYRSRTGVKGYLCYLQELRLLFLESPSFSELVDKRILGNVPVENWVRTLGNIPWMSGNDKEGNSFLRQVLSAEKKVLLLESIGAFGQKSVKISHSFSRDNIVFSALRLFHEIRPGDLLHGQFELFFDEELGRGLGPTREVFGVFFEGLLQSDLFKNLFLVSPSNRFFSPIAPSKEKRELAQGITEQLHSLGRIIGIAAFHFHIPFPLSVHPYIFKHAFNTWNITANHLQYSTNRQEDALHIKSGHKRRRDKIVDTYRRDELTAQDVLDLLKIYAEWDPVVSDSLRKVVEIWNCERDFDITSLLLSYDVSYDYAFTDSDSVLLSSEMEARKIPKRRLMERKEEFVDAADLLPYVKELVMFKMVHQFKNGWSLFFDGLFETMDGNGTTLLTAECLMDVIFGKKAEEDTSEAKLELRTHLLRKHIIQHMVFLNFEGKSYVKDWIKKWLETLCMSEIQRFMRFISGCAILMSGGIPLLPSAEAHSKGVLVIHLVVGEKEQVVDQRLPYSATCINTMFVPLYSAYSVLTQNFKMALEFGCNGFSFV